jgi:hypothetical protein
MIMDLRERRARAALRSLGVTQPLLTRLGPTLWLGLLLVVAVLLQVHDYMYTYSLRLGPLATPLATIGAVFLALHQYRQQRTEATIAGAFSRLDIVNRCFSSADAAHVLGPLFSNVREATWAEGLTDTVRWQQRMYIFFEIDNLQLGLERFRLGHSSAYQALRTLDLFCTRCQSEEFLKAAQELVAEGSGSYTRETRQVVSQLTVGYRPLAEAE